MTTPIRTALAQFYADPSQFNFSDPAAKRKFELVFLGGRLNDGMNALAKDNPGWAFFNWLWRRYDGRDGNDTFSPVHPDTICQAAELLGFTDVEPLAAWVDQCRVPGQSISTINKLVSSALTLPYDTMDDADAALIQTTLLANCNIDQSATWHWQDGTFKVPSKADLEIILAQCPSQKMTYRAEREDCDDFANQLRGWLSYNGYGNLTIGYTEIALLAADGSCVGAHACNVVIYKDGDCYQVGMIEPQNCTLHGPKDVWLGNGLVPAVSQQIYFSNF